MEGKNNEKFIDREILNLILPEYENLKMQPQFFINLNKDNEENNKEDKENKEYFQNVSLLGPRGSGKTNALNIIIDYLKEQKNYIVFDLITPETINEEEDLLGWIISLVTEKAEEILKERKLKQEYEDNYKCNLCGKYNYEFKNKVTELNRKIKELKESYFLRRSTYNEIIANDTLSTMEYIEKKSKKLKADTNLKTSFFKLVDELVDNKEYKILIFSFDDVDIYSSKVCEVLKIIMNYLSHKNIVTYIAGDYDSFIENITIELIKKENLLNKDLLDCEFLSGGESAKEIRESRAYEFIKKVLPPKYRYYIGRINNKNKYEIIQKLNKEYNIFPKDDKMIKKLNRYISFKGNIVYDYLEFLDDKIRGLRNIIDFVSREYSIIKFEEKNNNKNIQMLKYRFLTKLLECSINTNIELEKDEKLIRRIINIPNGGFLNKDFNGYVNYRFIIDELKVWQEKNNTKKITKSQFVRMYRIFILSNFFEILIEVLINRKSIIHGKEEVLKIINNVSYNEKKIKLIPNLEDLREIIFLKEKIFENLRYEEISCIFSEENKSNYIRYTYLKCFFNYEEKKPFVSEQEYIVNDVFGNIIEKDFRWCDEQIRWIYNNSINSKEIIESFIDNINSKFKKIKNFINFNNLESLLDNVQYKKNILPQENINLSFDEIFTFFDLIIPVQKSKNNIIEISNLMNAMENEKLKLKKEIDALDIDERFKLNKIILKEESARIDFISNIMEKFISDNASLIDKVKNDFEIMPGSIDQENLDKDLVEQFIFREVDLENLIKENNLEKLNIKNEKYTIAFNKKNILIVANNENQDNIIKCEKYKLLLNNLKKCNLKQLIRIDNKLDDLNREIVTFNITILKEMKKNDLIENELKKNKLYKSYINKNEKLNFNIIFSLFSALSEENLEYKKIYLNLMLKRIYDKLVKDIFVNLINLKNKIEDLLDRSNDLRLQYIIENNIYLYYKKIKFYDFDFNQLFTLKSSLKLLIQELEDMYNKYNTNRRESEIKRTLDKVNNIIDNIEYICENEDIKILNIRRNFTIYLFNNILLELINIEIYKEKNLLSKKSTYIEFELLKEALDKFKKGKNNSTLKLYLENMGNNEIESVF
ncbi:hypothetical protein QYB49_000082 [Clostridium perfringens]|nr:hypothetical protein [Clostridium perfringens]